MTLESIGMSTMYVDVAGFKTSAEDVKLLNKIVVQLQEREKHYLSKEQYYQDGINYGR